MTEGRRVPAWQIALIDAGKLVLVPSGRKGEWVDRLTPIWVAR
jgi:hypothetical protein